MKAIMIKQCSDPLMWYRNMVGQVVPLAREDTDVLWSREPAGHINIILRQDAVLVEITNEGKQLLVE